MKILISLFTPVTDSLNKNSIPAFYETIISKLVTEGNEVKVFISKRWNMNYGSIPSSCLLQVIKFNPDVCILFNNTFFDISNVIDCPIIVYGVDTPEYFSNKGTLLKNIERYKFIISQDEDYLPLQRDFSVKKEKILKMPFFTEIYSENKEHKNNICFIGTKFFNGNAFNVISEHLDNANRYEVGSKLINIIKSNPFISKVDLINAFPESELILKSCDLNFKNLVFAISDFIRVKTLSNVADLGLTLYGPESWIKHSYNEPYLIFSYNNDNVYSIKHNQDIYNSHKIGLNINHIQAQSGFSWRVCDILASNCCLVSEYKPNIEKYFAKANIPLFKSPYEARELCKDLLKNENKRLDIVAMSQEIINKDFRLKNFWNDFTSFIFEGRYFKDNKKKGTVEYSFVNEENELNILRTEHENELRILRTEHELSILRTEFDNKIKIINSEIDKRESLIKKGNCIGLKKSFYFFCKAIFGIESKFGKKYKKYKQLEDLLNKIKQ